MKPEIGKYYQTRSGKIVVAIRKKDDYYTIIETVDTKYRTSVWSDTGKYYSTIELKNSAWDLMEEVIIASVTHSFDGDGCLKSESDKPVATFTMPSYSDFVPEDYVFGYDIEKVGNSICFALNKINTKKIKREDLLKTFALSNGSTCFLFCSEELSTLSFLGENIIFGINVRDLGVPYVFNHVIPGREFEVINKIHIMLKEVSDILKSKRAKD